MRADVAVDLSRDLTCLMSFSLRSAFCGWGAHTDLQADWKLCWTCADVFGHVQNVKVSCAHLVCEAAS